MPKRKYKHKVKKDTKTIGQLIKENHWSVVGLAKSLNITKEDLKKWVQ